MSLIAVLPALLKLPEMLSKKKDFVLIYYENGTKPEAQTAAISYRQCRLEQKKLISCGQNPDWFLILRKGTKVPPRPPQPKQGKRGKK